MNSLDSTPDPDPLDPREAAVAELLAAGSTLAQVAERLGVSVSTVRRTKDKPAVQARVRRIQLEAVNAVSGVLLAGGREAAEELLRLGREGKRDDAVKLRSVVATLDMVYKYAALTSLEADMLEMRARLEGRDRPPDGTDPDPVTLAPEPPSPGEPNGQLPAAPFDSEPGAGLGLGDGEPT